ncbi:MAG: hypothetical protein ACRC1D_07155, partial [Culicoidibacterales bacterium]
DMNFIFGAQIVWDVATVQTICQNWLIHHWPAIEAMTTGSFQNFAFHPQNEANYYGTNWQRFQQVVATYQN